MARLFISYKRQDQDLAFAVRQWLIDEQGWTGDDIFVDLDHLRAGEDWARKLLTEAEHAQAMLFLASDAALHEDSFCYRELRRAQGQVLAVTLGGVTPDDERLRRALPYESLARQITALDQQPTEAFEFTSPMDGTRGVVGLNRNQVESIGAILRDLGIAPNSFDWSPTDLGPYPGLAPLREGDEAIFFGRDTEIRDGLRALGEMQESVTDRAHVIQAPSGAGKSSFLRAGLWQRLRNHAAFTPLCIVRARHGILSHPDWGLVSGLSDPRCNLLKLSRAAIESRVATDLGGFFGELADADAGPDGRRTLLLGIDQGEEIAALGAGEKEEFEKLMGAILSAPAGVDIRLVLTVRDDSVDAMLDRLAASGLPAGAVRTDRLHRMSPQRYRDIIRGPAEAALRAEWPIDIPSTLEIALADAAGADRSEVGDALPLLAIALQRMVLNRRAPTGEIDLLPEDAPAFIAAAVADTVTDALEAAQADHRDLEQLIVPQLATWDPNAGEGGAAKRLVAHAYDLFAGRRAELRPLADALVDHRLLTRTQAADTQSYEVAHEALLRVAPLGEILYSLREKYVLANILRMEALDWHRNGQREDQLARAGARLEIAQELLADPVFGPDLSRTQTGIAPYLEACAAFATSEEARREALRQEELALANERAQAARIREEAAETEARSARDKAKSAEKLTNRTRVGLVLVSVLLLISASLGWLAYQNGRVADQRAVEAEKSASEAIEQREEALFTESRLLALFARQEMTQSEFGNAVGLALRALPAPSFSSKTRPMTLEPRQVLYDSYHELKEQRALRGHEDSVLGALVLPDGRILTWSEDATARIWGADGAEGPLLRGHEDSVLGALVLPDGRILTWSDDATARIWGTEGAEGRVLRGHERGVLGALALPDGRILTWSLDRTARIWGTDGAEGPVLRGHDGPVRGALVLPDGRILTWSYDATARIWGADGAAGPVLRGHERQVAGALAMPGGRILTWSDDATARSWGADGAKGPVLRGHDGPVTGALVLPDGRILTWSQDATARIWGADGAEGPVLRGHEDAVRGALVLPDGRILTWSVDATARIWGADGAAGLVLRGHERQVAGALAMPGGRILTWSYDATARIWDADGAEGPVLHGHRGWVYGALVLPDGRILTWSVDATARIWGADGAEGPLLRGHEDSVRGALVLPDGRILTWSEDATARIWGADGAEGPVLRGHKGPVFGALALPGRRILTWSEDATARIWGADGAEGPVLRGHQDSVRGALVLPDGRILTWSEDATARIWDADGAEGPVLHGHRGWVYGALVLPDGRILTWSQDATARLWPGSTQALIACASEVEKKISPLSAQELCRFGLADEEDCGR